MVYTGWWISPISNPVYCFQLHLYQSPFFRVSRCIPLSSQCHCHVNHSVHVMPEKSALLWMTLFNSAHTSRHGYAHAQPEAWGTQTHTHGRAHTCSQSCEHTHTHTQACSSWGQGRILSLVLMNRYKPRTVNVSLWVPSMEEEEVHACNVLFLSKMCFSPQPDIKIPGIINHFTDFSWIVWELG